MLLWRNAFERHMREALGRNLRLIWTVNRRVMISLRRKNGLPVLRVHESFATAGQQLLGDLVTFLLRGHKAPQSIKDFVRTIESTREPRAIRIVTRGKHHDLRDIYRKLNAEYFGEKLAGHITWGRRAFGVKRSITFGTYTFERKLIRIHPVLDTGLTPLFYLESVVHHEMVHEYLHTVEGIGRKRGKMHTRGFRELERGFKFYEMAKAWEKRHLNKLLRYQPAEE
ncbi:MAG: hypothetical protein HZA03_04540 [Nitrospinae bacterium]|nr:hypothetical protein [Nitrospinota bacterium]